MPGFSETGDLSGGCDLDDMVVTCCCVLDQMVIPPKFRGVWKWNFHNDEEDILMKQSKYSEAQIMGILNQAESGVPVADLCREHGMSTASF